MRKLPRQECLHYAKEKGIGQLDTYFALWELSDKEIFFFRSNKEKLKGLHLKAQEIVKTLLKCRYEIFEVAENLDKIVMGIYKNIKPEHTARFFENFYRDAVNVKFVDLYGIKRKNVVHGQEDEDVYALTDSDEE